jgi:prophage maintenance system killer protein
MTSIRYFGLHACKEYGFPYIYARLTTAEQAPNYEDEASGIAELGKVLSFVQNDMYYPTFEEKCAYLICSIAGSQYFSNGNKRLSVTILLMFLMLNEAVVSEDVLQLQNVLHEAFPLHVWDGNASIEEPYSLFLYNLAIIIGDRKKWPSDDFTTMRDSVSSIFALIHHRE